MKQRYLVEAGIYAKFFVPFRRQRLWRLDDAAEPEGLLCGAGLLHVAGHADGNGVRNFQGACKGCKLTLLLAQYHLGENLVLDSVAHSLPDCVLQRTFAWFARNAGAAGAKRTLAPYVRFFGADGLEMVKLAASIKRCKPVYVQALDVDIKCIIIVDNVNISRVRTPQTIPALRVRRARSCGSEVQHKIARAFVDDCPAGGCSVDGISDGI